MSIPRETVTNRYPNAPVTEVLEISVTENICGFILPAIAAENPHACDFLLQLFVYMIPGVAELGARGRRCLASQPGEGTAGDRGTRHVFG